MITYENLLLPRKPPSYRQTLVLERAGFLLDLCRNHHFGIFLCAVSHRPASGTDGVLCISEPACGGRSDHGLSAQRCAVLSNLSAEILLEEVMNL